MKMIQGTTLKTRIKFLRKKYKIKQIELADLCNVAQSSVARLERNATHNINVQFAIKLAQALHVTVEELFRDIQFKTWNKPTPITEETSAWVAGRKHKERIRPKNKGASA